MDAVAAGLVERERELRVLDGLLRDVAAGTGRVAVRGICASMSRSYHMLMAPDAPAATAMQRMAVSARTG